MKNLYLLLILTFMTFGLCSAQQISQRQVGITGGPSHTFYRNPGTHLRDAKGDLRGSAGFSAQYQLQGFFLKANLLYENKGIRYNAGKRPGPANGDCWGNDCDDIIFDCFGEGCDDARYAEYNAAKTKLHFITLPVLIGTYIKGTGIFINAGPYVGLNTWATRSSEMYGSQTDFDPQYDFGVAAGLGYARPIYQTLAVSSEVRHNFGLRGVQHNVGLNSTSLLFGVQYSFSGL